MKLSLTGLNHITAPVEVRERLAFQPDLLASAVAELRHMPGVQESVILSTCNRVELAMTADDAVDASSTLADFLARVRHVDPQSHQPRSVETPARSPRPARPRTGCLPETSKTRGGRAD